MKAPGTIRKGSENEIRYRILVCEFHQETNTFNPLNSGIEQFEAIRYLKDEAFFDVCRELPCAVHGMIDAIEEEGCTAVPTIDLCAQSCGRVRDDVFELLLRSMEDYIQAAGEFDAVFASLHGATSTESQDDACGVFVEKLRALIGEEKVIAASFDLHANITERMLKNADIVCGYQTYPHVDFYETGYRAAKLGLRKLRKEPAAVASTLIPMMVPPVGYTSLLPPFKDVIDYGKSLVEEGKLLDFTLFQVQPWLDISEIASCIIAIGTEEEQAEQYALELGKRLFENREGYWPELTTIDAVIDRAEMPESQKPVILVDSADSPNGGAVGDSIAAAMRIYERKSKIRAGMFVKDPEVVRQAFEVGVGGTARFSIGAKFTPGMPGPLVADARVRSLHDGVFCQEGPAGRGICNNIGRTAVISVGNMDIMVCEEPASSGDPQLLRHFGIEPSMYDMIVVKANTSYRVPYSHFATEFYETDTPGAGAANLKRFDWKHIPESMYPFDELEGYEVEPARIRRR